MAGSKSTFTVGKWLRKGLGDAPSEAGRAPWVSMTAKSLRRFHSYAPKKCALSLTRGPPNDPPGWNWLNGCLVRFCWSSKYVFEFNDSFRPNRMPVPLITFVPLLVITLTTPPVDRPY